MEKQEAQTPAPKSQVRISSCFLHGLSLAPISQLRHLQGSCECNWMLLNWANTLPIALLTPIPPGLSADPSSSLTCSLSTFPGSLFASLSSYKGKDTQKIRGIEKKHPQAAELVHWKQIATAKETALALPNLPSDNKSKAPKLALNHLGLLELAGRKIKAGREKGKRERSEVSGRKNPKLHK